MTFALSKKNIQSGKVAILYDAGALSGVKKIAGKVSEDIRAVFGAAPQLLEIDSILEKDLHQIEFPILVGTICEEKKTGKTPGSKSKGNLLTKLEAAGLLDLSDIRGKREVYRHQILMGLPSETIIEKKKKTSVFAFKTALVIAGSDKRGTVYGLFALSEMLGVSPFIDWLDVKPEKKTSFEIPDKYSFTSREPSVRFRGFFINDEWPAFGNYCNKRFGGFNAKCYEHVFELLLRLKGNYMWPAMWSAIFPNDGPGLLSAELADELGVVMGMSHHEPCLRQGEEYRYLRGPKSIYGDAWNFLSNEKGITKFWEDGLKRSGKFENVITVGMRGEADTAIMGKDATLKDNIDLLRKVLKTQNKLIRKYVNDDLDEVPRMLALYKEVEPYFYGDEKTPGLMGDPELEGVTLMLCDDNYGNLRTVPTPEMRGHKGGYGMYYHFDYHGFPISFEWFNTTHLSKVWEQMTMAYDFGIRNLWIVNVGDIFSNEYPLAYFLDLAYDFDRWGTSNKNSAHEYTKTFVAKHFGEVLTSAQKRKTAELLLGYTRITHARRTEAMNDNVYAPFAYGETQAQIATVDTLMKDAQKLYDSLSGNGAYRFYEIVYLPLMANLNVQKMWLLTTLNHGYAKRASTYALSLADEIDACIQKDRELVSELHKIHGGMWYGMGLSEHIGFKNWCEEGCEYPVIHTFDTANKNRIIVTIPETEQFSEFGFWTRKTLVLPSFLDPDSAVGTIELSTACSKSCAFTVECDAPYLSVSETKGTVRGFELKKLVVKLDRTKLKKRGKTAAKSGAKNPKAGGEGADYAQIIIRSGDGFVSVIVPVRTKADFDTSSAIPNTFFWCGGCDATGRSVMNYICMEAAHYAAKTAGAKGDFEEIPDYNRGLTGLKAYPQDRTFTTKKDAPTLTYNVVVPKAGKYTLRLMTNPGNPPSKIPELFCGISTNGGKMKKINTIREGFAVGDGNDIWSAGVLDNLRTTEVALELLSGSNTIEVTAQSPNFVLAKLVLFEEGKAPLDSYLGPKETWHT